MITVNDSEVKYTEGMTVSDALRAAGESADIVTLVMADGKVLPYGSLNTQLLADGAIVKVLRIISGG